LRKTAAFFADLVFPISHETIRRNVPPIPNTARECSGYFVYDEQYVHIDGKERYRALFKDAITSEFHEEVVDQLSEESLTQYFLSAFKKFDLPESICITTDGYHYESILHRVSEITGIKINRQRCLFHIEKDLAHKIHEAGKDTDLEGAKKLVKYLFFPTPANLSKLRENAEAISNLTEGKTEREIVEIMLPLIRDLYSGDPTIRDFLSFLRKHRKEVFLYLSDPKVEKTSDKAEQHFSIMSWLLKHRFKTKEGLLRTSYWYHTYLSTEK
jgi:hypothetical protein